MKMRKYQGKTEKEAILAVKEELGSEALILSVKHIKPRGIIRLFRKPFVEVTAALDDRSVMGDKPLPKIQLNAEAVKKNDALMNQGNLGKDSELDEFKNFIERFSSKQRQKQTAVKEAVESVQQMIDTVVDDSSEVMQHKPSEQSIMKGLILEEESVEETPMLKLIYEQLIENEVSEPYANELMVGLAEYIYKNSPTIDDVVSIVYKRIIKNLSEYDIINLKKKSNIVFFVGPTGVGKTTTIAKIASLFSLNLDKKIALITSDTYRIAAVEQLRTYANILGVPIKVVYTKDELHDAIEFFADKELVLVDTAGRSHKNEEHQQELKELLDSVDDKDVYLTLSVATKYKDLMKIVNTYKGMTDFKIIFTKLDETMSFGNIFNIRMATQAKLSYVTFGQNVPDDISEINPHVVAKNILGGEDDGSSE